MKKLVLATAAAGLLAGAGAAHGGDLEIVFAEDRVDHRTYDPRVTQSRHEEQVIVQVFDQLLSADENGNLHPGLARSWQVSEDNLSYTFHLLISLPYLLQIPFPPPHNTYTHIPPHHTSHPTTHTHMPLQHKQTHTHTQTDP